MTIKCLAFDLDGTLLLDESKRMDPRTVDSIQRAMAQGMHVVIASGRDKNGCKFVYEPLGLENGNHFLALVNGQVVYDFENKEYDLDDVLTAEDGVKIQKVCKQFGVEGIFQCGYDFYSYISSLNRVKKKVKNAILGEPDDYGLKDGKENRNFIDLPFEEIRLTQDINKVIMVHSPRFFEKNFEGIKAALSDYDVLKDAGTVSHESAQEKALDEYERFRLIQDQNYLSDFDKEIKIWKEKEGYGKD